MERLNLNLKFYWRGGGEVWFNLGFLYLFFYKKNSLLDHTLRSTCKFLIMQKKLVYQKIYYIISSNLIIWKFFTYLSIYLLWIDINPLPPIKTKLKYVKNAHIFKTTTQKKSTQCIINSFLFLLLSKLGDKNTQSKLRWDH